MSKKLFTQVILDAGSYELDIDSAMKEWWVQQHSNSHYKLSYKGFQEFKKHYPPHKFHSKLNLNTGIAIKRLNMLNCPWYGSVKNLDVKNDVYIPNKTHNTFAISYLYLFSSKIATMATLFTDFDEYLNIIQ